MIYDNDSVRIGSVRVGYRYVPGVETPTTRATILLHGLNAHSGTWRFNIARLAGRWPLYALSLPQCRGPQVSPEAVQTYAGYVGRLADDLGIKEAVVVGHSLGGWIAMQLVSDWEGNVSRLVLEDSAGVESEQVAAVEASKLPVLIVWGEGDTITPVSIGRKFHQLITASRFEVMAGAGHVPHWETPEAYNRMVEPFVKGWR